MVVLLLHHHFFCFPVWMSGAMVFCHLPKTASWKGLPADLAVFSLPNPFFWPQEPSSQLKAAVFCVQAPETPGSHLLSKGKPRWYTTWEQGIYPCLSDTPHFSACHVLPSRNFICLLFLQGSANILFQPGVYLNRKQRSPNSPQRIS